MSLWDNPKLLDPKSYLAQMLKLAHSNLVKMTEEEKTQLLKDINKKYKELLQISGFGFDYNQLN